MRSQKISPAYIKYHSDKQVKSGCWIWLRYVQSSGYGQFCAKGQRWLAHRASWTAFNGEIPKGLWVLHKCDTPRCVNPEHLFLGTSKDNTQDCKTKGRMGIQRDANFTRINRKRKLSDDAVRDIRASSESLKDLASRYNVSMACISTVRRGKRKKLVI